MLPDSPPSGRSILPIFTCLIYRKRTAVERDSYYVCQSMWPLFRPSLLGQIFPGGVQVTGDVSGRPHFVETAYLGCGTV